MTEVPGVRVDLMVAGYCRQRERFARSGGSWWRSIRFPALVALIRATCADLDQPSASLAPLLFDTGYATRFFEVTRRLPAAIYRWLTPVTCGPEDAAATQLRGLGVDAADVGQVVVSHFHGDHVAGLKDFPSARIIRGEGSLPTGWVGERPLTGLRQGRLKALIPQDLGSREVVLGADTAEPVPGLDGFVGQWLLDGAAWAVHLPGHTAGHLGLYLPKTQGPPLLLVGDACWSTRAYTDGQLPHPLAARINESETDYVGTIAQLGRLRSQRPDLLIVPSHDQEAVDAARSALS